MLNYALSLMGLGASLFALESSSLIPAQYKKYFYTSGIIIFFVGLVALLLWQVQIVSRGTKFLVDKISIRLTEFFNYEYDVVYVKSECLKEICKIGHSLIGENHPNEELLRYRLKKNSKIIKIIKSLNSKRKGVSGYYIAYPINCEADRLLQKGLIKNGKGISEDQLLSEFSCASAIYISMVAGRNIH